MPNVSGSRHLRLDRDCDRLLDTGHDDELGVAGAFCSFLHIGIGIALLVGDLFLLMALG